MKLYEVPHKTNVKLISENNITPPVSLPLFKDDIIFFDHLDGMYSYCKDSLGNIVHLGAFTEVEIIK